MTDTMVRLWDKNWSHSVYEIVPDWQAQGITATFSVPRSSRFALALLERKHTNLTVLSEPAYKCWVVHSFHINHFDVVVDCVTHDSLVSQSVVPGWIVGPRGKWRCFREKVPLSMNPMWVVWDDQYNEYLFKNGGDAVKFVGSELHKRYWAGVVDERRKQLE